MTSFFQFHSIFPILLTITLIADKRVTSLICLELKNPVFMELLFVLFNHLNLILQFYFILIMHVNIIILICWN
jgi:hypothetical protein